MDSNLCLRSLLATAALAAGLVAGACAASAPAEEASEPSSAGATGGETSGEPSATAPGEPAFGPACGGLAGFSCPGSATCEDDPRDECDPAQGGADCGGVCHCESTELCAPGMVFDASPDVCACVPEEARDDVCARARCMRGMQCVSEGGMARCVPASE